jgi:hypothetical protein
VLRYSLGVVFFICFFSAVACFFLALYYFITMHGSVRPERKPLLPFLGPFHLLFPQLWNKTGNRARVMFMVCTLLFGLLFGVMTILLNIPLDKH